MLVFINGSINSGKTTTAKLLAEKLDAKFLNIDDLNDLIPNFNLATDIPKSFELAIAEINRLTKEGKDVVANYVIRTEDWDGLLAGVEAKPAYFITLAPPLEVAQSQRGERVLTDWETRRIQYHYDTGVPAPKHGIVIDNSEMSLEQTVDTIIKYIESDTSV